MMSDSPSLIYEARVALRVLLRMGLILALSVPLSCQEDLSGPSSVMPQYGLTGTVLDTTGHQLDGVGVYCLYYLSAPAPDVLKANPPLFFRNPLNKVAGVDTFAFALFPCIPNPFSSSTYVQFAIPRAAGVALTIAPSDSKVILYQYSGTLSAGMYQLYLHRLVDSLSLENGLYTCMLSARFDGGGVMQAQQQMLVVSDHNQPSAVTGSAGTFLFGYDKAFVGDSLVLNNGLSVSMAILSDQVNLLFVKAGYRPNIVTVRLYPGVLLHRDIVMLKEP